MELLLPKGNLYVCAPAYVCNAISPWDEKKRGEIEPPNTAPELSALGSPFAAAPRFDLPTLSQLSLMELSAGGEGASVLKLVA